MGRYVILPLHGTARFSRGVSAANSSFVVRLRSHLGSPVNPSADFALVRSKQELQQAADARVNSVLIVSDDGLENLPEAQDCSRLISVPAKFAYFLDGDIIGFHPQSGRFRTLYRRASMHNSFLVTDRCNHYCLMCSQPPKDIDDRWILDELMVALALVAKDTGSLCFTGGEPLLDWREFIQVLARCRDELPNTAAHVLSNGRAFARDEVVAAWAALRHPNLTVGIPIYSAVDHVHDYVVQARGAFDETVLGILKLKDGGQRVEVRVVLHALTAPRIVQTCRWLARNLPFVNHVALMGLENTGFAIANADELWIDPVDYRAELAEGVSVLAAARVNVSVYNLQRCVLDRTVWPYAVQSISDWKNGYIDECDRCTEKDRCSGFFTSGRPRRSRGISPILVS
jgi:His-Xaa-Ser system radical SAM maturase HxsC